MSNLRVLTKSSIMLSPITLLHSSFLLSSFKILLGDRHVELSGEEAAGAAGSPQEDFSNKSMQLMPYITFKLS
jgi:hypothetical protein